VLVVYRRHGRAIAAAGAGRVKLLPDSAWAILRANEPGVRLNPAADKRVFHLDESMLQRHDLPLDAFLVLPSPEQRSRSAAVGIAPMTPARLFHELVKNTFVTPLADAARLQRNFACNTQLASEVRGLRLSYPSGIANVPDVRDVILEYLRHRATEDIQ
jgi:hypothetical protein